MMQPQYLRCRDRIKTLASGDIKKYWSIGAAKKAAAKLQRDAVTEKNKSIGKLGNGVVRVVDKF